MSVFDDRRGSLEPTVRLVLIIKHL